MKYKIKETRVTEFIFLVDAENEEEALEKTFDIEPTETIGDIVVYEDPYYECELHPEITIERVKENADI